MTGQNLRVAAVTCAKNEAPFILEWIAFHKLIGFTDIIVFTNDCTDGTDDLLDRLDEMGHVQHLPNPRVLNEKLRFQFAALTFASQMRAVRKADWRMSFDSDEFVNVSLGSGKVDDLFDQSPNAKLISICQLQFGCSHRDKFQPGLSTEQFTLHQSHAPQKGTKNRRDLERGLKTFVRQDAPITQWKNHLPDLEPKQRDNVEWVYGKNRSVGQSVRHSGSKSLPAEGCYEAGQLNHYATRSRQSFLVQAHRGNAVKLDQKADVKYWKRYNHNVDSIGSIGRHVPQLRELMDEWLSDPKLRNLQDSSNAHHQALIQKLLEEPDYAALFNRISRLDNRAKREKEQTHGA